MSHKKWFSFGLLVMAVELAAVGIINYVVDPFGIFRYGTGRRDLSRQYIGPNMHFIKTRYIAQNPKKFDCLIFGSSRVRGIDGRQMRDAVCYNMFYSDGLPRDHLDNLRYLLSKEARPKLVLVGLDEFSYKRDPADHFGYYGRHPYPPVVQQNTYLFYLKYLIRYSSRSKKAFKAFLSKKKPFPYDHFESGLLLTPDIDTAIEADPAKHTGDPKFKRPLISKGDRIMETLDEVRKLVSLLETHDVKWVVFINPIHQTTYLATDLQQHLLFEKELSKITDFYDFSGLNSVTTNNYYYHETSHYRMNVGQFMLARMFGWSTVRVPDDFGVLVTPDNIEKHLTELRRQRARKTD